MSTDLYVTDFMKICRTCLEEKDNMISITSEKLINKLTACSRVQIEIQDELPQHICSNCIELLDKSFSFKQQCEESEHILRNILQKKSSKSPTEDRIHSDVLESDVFSVVKVEIDNNSVDFPEKDHSTNDSYPSDKSHYDGDSDTTPTYTPRDVKPSQSQILINRTKKMDGSKCNILTLTCNICQKSLSNILALARHMNTHSETRILTFRCPDCGKGFCESGNLKRHMDRHKGNAQYSCEECQKRFYELCALALHMKQKHNAMTHKCRICSLEFYHTLQLEQHERIHVQKTYNCDECGKTFKKAQALERHKYAHSIERPFSCDLCDKSFKFNFGLTKHKKICHSGPQPREICSICGKSILRTSLPLHLKSHDKDTLYKCTHCPKEYYCEATLKQHIKRKHTKKGSQYKHLCTICGRKVISPKELQIHMTSHTGEKLYQCHLCEKRYRTSSAQLAHVRVAHEDERPYSCSICFKAFHTKAIMKNHMRTHTGEKPFPCPVCGRAFGFKAVLKTHMKAHTYSKLAKYPLLMVFVLIRG